MGVDPNWGRFLIGPDISHLVPVCPFLSFLEPSMGTNRDQRGQTGTKRDMSGQIVRNGPNTVSGSTVSNTELSDFSVGQLSESLSAYYLCAKANSPSFSQNSPSLPRNSVRLSEFSSPKQYSRNSIPPVP